MSPTPKLPAEILLLIDSGYSHTTVTPLFRGRPLHSAIRRLDIGGKFLTNYLKELISIRHYNMMDETHLVNEIKEACCYVSSDFKNDLEKTWKGGLADRRNRDLVADGIVKDYVLPDYNKHTKGFMRDHDPSVAGKMKKLAKGGAVPDVQEDILTMGNERFVVPELLFSPGDIGLKAPGLADMVMQSLSGLPVGLWPGLLANIVVVGGNARIVGFLERLEKEVRMLAPAECVVRVARPVDPITSTWHGGANLARDEEALKKLSVTRQEYEEHGAGWVARKFAGKAS